MRHKLRLTAGLALVFVLTLASTDPVDLALGGVIGMVAVALLGNRLRLEPGGELPAFPGRAVWFPVFAGAVFVDVAKGTWEVAVRVLRLSRLDRPGIVRIPIGERSERGVAVSALATTLSPGSLLVDVDWHRGDILLHVIDASDPDGLRRDHQHFYDRYQRRVFP